METRDYTVDDPSRIIDACVKAIPNANDGELSLGIVAPPTSDEEDRENLTVYADMALEDAGYDNWSAEWKEVEKEAIGESGTQLKLFATRTE